MWFVVTREVPAAVDPGRYPLRNRTFREDDEAVRLGTFHNLVRAASGVILVAAVGRMGRVHRKNRVARVSTQSYRNANGPVRKIVQQIIYQG
jgi:hypothetical protein